MRRQDWRYATVAGSIIAPCDPEGRLPRASPPELPGGPVHDRRPGIASLHGNRAGIAAMAEEIAAHMG
ncbi:hypothetical protein [Rhodovulum sp. YEN HP10]|uniref:hypothetical protein n=1 Tax=Rhodovulum sp. HP10 TaxID=3387397 RepID=UPI0039E1A7B2